ncbi:MAG: calcium/sodium antiporter [Acidobacteria bacterium]|nr:MAG: calcium/sodium antiporter [Acidobacteriota bacterium]
MTILIWLALGLTLLAFGGDALVRGASRLAAILGVSPLVIGVTVVALATSGPETAVSLQASFAGEPDIALGNVIGSNILNIFFILGLCALLIPLVIAQRLLFHDVPIMIGASLLVFGLAFDGGIDRWDGLLLLALMMVYLVFTVRHSRRETSEVRAVYESEYPRAGRYTNKTLGLQLFKIAVGLVMLILGARWLVWSATEAARVIGVSELVIGLTVVAAGTSIPELVASIVAILRGERDIAIGNVIGSNIFNLLAILGAASLISRVGIPVAPAAFSFDMPVMIASAVACLPIFFWGHRLASWEGGLFVGYYILYASYLVMTATRHHGIMIFETALWIFVIPLTVLTIAVGVFRSREPRSNKVLTIDD